MYIYEIEMDIRRKGGHAKKGPAERASLSSDAAAFSFIMDKTQKA